LKQVYIESILEKPEPARGFVIKKNCWEVMDCGRGPDNTHVELCPAANASTLHGVHGGLNGGRSCWVVAGTLCNGEVSGTFAKKMDNCLICPFYRQVREEEPEMKSHHDLLIRFRRE
jgi:hypothetical protein